MNEKLRAARMKRLLECNFPADGRTVECRYQAETERKRGEKKMINTAAVKARMKALRMTQREAAEKLGYTQATLSLKTNNRRRMTLEEAWALAKLLGVEEDLRRYFFAEADE